MLLYLVTTILITYSIPCGPWSYTPHFIIWKLDYAVYAIRV